MKIAFLSYPMLFQNLGGLQLQVRETLAALQRAGTTAVMFDYNTDKLEDFDVAHVFSINHGNYHMIQMAKEKGLKVVTSPLLPTTWTKGQAARSKVLDKLIRKFSGWHAKSDYSMDKLSLDLSDHLVVLGDREKLASIVGFNQTEDKITIIPNGVSSSYKFADRSLFSERYPELLNKPIILNVASVNPRKNQLVLSEACANMDVNLVIIGPYTKNNQAYLEKIQAHKNVSYLGPLPYNDAMLVSAYAAARVFCLPSTQEVLPISIYESLAAGTPALFTQNCAVNFNSMENVCWSKVDPKNSEEIQLKLKSLLSIKKRTEQCRKLAEKFTWENVAFSLTKIYKKVMS